MPETGLNTGVPTAGRPGEHKEIQVQEQEWFDLQPIEKKLCAYSFGLGIVLLVIFIFVFEISH